MAQITKLKADARPGITDGAMAWLIWKIRPSWNVLEYGSGHSTVWFASRARFIVSIEEQPGWIRLVKEANVQHGDSVELILAERPYANAAWLGPYDFAFVDGRERVQCVRVAMGLVEPGGFLMLDDSQRERYSEAKGWLSDCWQIVHHSVQEAKTDYCYPGNATTVWQKP